MRGAGRGEGRLRAAADHRARTLFRLRCSAWAPGFSGSRSAPPGSVCLGRRRSEGRGSPGTASRPGTQTKVAHSWGRKVSGSGGFGAGPDCGLRPGLPSPFLGLGLELQLAGERKETATLAGATNHTCGVTLGTTQVALLLRHGLRAAGSAHTRQRLKDTS